MQTLIVRPTIKRKPPIPKPWAVHRTLLHQWCKSMNHIGCSIFLAAQLKIGHAHTRSKLVATMRCGPECTSRRCLAENETSMSASISALQRQRLSTPLPRVKSIPSASMLKRVPTGQPLWLNTNSLGRQPQNKGTPFAKFGRCMAISRLQASLAWSLERRSEMGNALHRWVTSKKMGAGNHTCIFNCRSSNPRRQTCLVLFGVKTENKRFEIIQIPDLCWGRCTDYSTESKCAFNAEIGPIDAGSFPCKKDRASEIQSVRMQRWSIDSSKVFPSPSIFQA